MSGGLAAGLAGVLLALVVLAVLASIALRRARDRAALPGWAADHGWSYQEGDKFLPGPPWSVALPAGGTGNEGILLQLDGSAGGPHGDRAVCAAEYQYQRVTVTREPNPGGGRSLRRKNVATIRMGVIAATLGKEHYAPVVVTRRHLKGSVRPVPDDASPQEEFERHYTVKEGHRPSPRAMRAALRENLPSFQVQGSYLILTWQGALGVKVLQERIAGAAALADAYDNPGR